MHERATIDEGFIGKLRIGCMPTYPDQLPLVGWKAVPTGVQSDVSQVDITCGPISIPIETHQSNPSGLSLVGAVCLLVAL